MSATSVSGLITVTIGTNQITLTTADINQTPKVFSLPKGQKVKVNLGDLNSYLNTNFGIPAINFPGITATDININKFFISTVGIVDIAATFVFGAGKGWPIFPGFTLNEVGFEVNFSKVPNISAIAPPLGAVGATVILTGFDLDKATKVDFGDVAGTIVPNSNNATSVKVTVPQLSAGIVQVTLTNTDGTSAPVAFTVSA